MKHDAVRNKLPPSFAQELGRCVAVAWKHFGRFGFSIEVYMDEILDGRSFGLDIAVVETNQGVLYRTRGYKPFHRVIYNISYQRGIGTRTDVANFVQVKKEIEAHFKKQRRKRRKLTMLNLVENGMG